MSKCKQRFIHMFKTRKRGKYKSSHAPHTENGTVSVEPNSAISS